MMATMMGKMTLSVLETVRSCFITTVRSFLVVSAFKMCIRDRDRNILQGHLTGQHHALCAHVVGGAGRRPVGDACLGGHVHIDVRCKGLEGIQLSLIHI